MNQIRPIAICVFLREHRILVAEGYDSTKNEYFYRPLGGGIEFGETSKQTICREVMEEVNLAVEEDSLRYLGTLENIFTFNGATGHEVVLVYDGVLQNSRAYKQDVVSGREANGTDIRAVWMDIDEFGEGKAILYPAGLLDLLGNASGEVFSRGG